MDAATRFRTYQRMLHDLGAPVRPDTVLLDLGCGAGNLVAEGRKQNCLVFGCDISFKEGKHTAELEASGAIRKVSLDPYRLPFDDGSIDCVVSDQVFEHVMDYDACIAEIRRVLKSDGTTLHVFPSRYSPIEPHVFVPFATIHRSRAWLRLWAKLGARRSFQRGIPASRAGDQNYEYLTQHTNYLTKRQIRDHFKGFFPHVTFAESAFLKYSERAHILHTLSKAMPFLPAVYSFARARVVFARRGTGASAARGSAAPPGESGSREWDRTTDHLHVKEVLYH